MLGLKSPFDRLKISTLSLILICFFISQSTIAETSTVKDITSSGYVVLSSPTPTTIPSPYSNSPNLAPIPGKWGDYHLYGDVYYGPLTNPQITHLDNNVLHNGHPSIRIDGPGIPANGAREVNGRWITVKPGDHIVFSVWIKTAAQPSWEQVGPGAIFGFDVVGDKLDNILEVTPRIPQNDVWTLPISNRIGTPIYVPYGSDWTKLTIDIIIPYMIFTTEDNGYPLAHGPQKIIAINPFLGASWNKGESASVWFADAELYINP